LVVRHKSVAQLHPDLVILDLKLKNVDGMQLIKQLTDQFPSLRILILSPGDESIFAERTLRAGAKGYLMEDADTESVLAAIHTILEGGIYLSPQINTRLLHHYLEKPRQALPGGLGQLSDRELQIFQMIGAGMPNREMAKSLRLSVKTVETHHENIKHKLRLANATALKAAAVAWVREQKLPPDLPVSAPPLRVGVGILPPISSRRNHARRKRRGRPRSAAIHLQTGSKPEPCR
jgi:DNA-binding NarL/FixJ family response regulator